MGRRLLVCEREGGVKNVARKSADGSNRVSNGDV
jgi:hypothetical protein